MKQRTLNSNAIKLIAIAAMTIDHLAWVAFPGYSREVLPMLLHMIGRLTCPIMCYCVAEGYHHTRDVNRYTARLFGFALVSHFAYRFAALNPAGGGGVLNQTSVMWSLAWGLVMLRVEGSERIRHAGVKALLILLICAVSFPSDWSCVAALWILVVGSNRGNFRAQVLWMSLYGAIYAAVYFFAIDRAYGLIQLAFALAFPILRLYNGQRGKRPRLNRWLKWFFYIYYPLHLALLGLLARL